MRAAGYDDLRVETADVTAFYLLVGRLSSMMRRRLLHELEPTVEQLLDRHLATTKEWFPHEHVPYGRGRDLDPGESGPRPMPTSAGRTIDDAVRSSLIVNLLTEDNLPYYFRTIERTFGADGAWGAWVRRWTAEEGRHSMAIYGYLMVTRAVDPAPARAGPHGAGVGAASRPSRPPAARLRLRRPAGAGHPHRPPQHRADDRRPAGYDVMMRVAADENLHHLFYRDLAAGGHRASTRAG